MIENPNWPEKLKIVKNSYQMLGLRETFLNAAMYLMSTVSPRDRFDAKYGTETNGVVEPDDAGIDEDRVRKSAVRYVPTREVVLKYVLNYLASKGLERFSFVDLGCGKGRAILIASEYPFMEILGVDASPKHCKVAQSNIERFLKVSERVKCRNIQVRCEDASKINFPNTWLVVYMYHPFGGDIFKSVIDHLFAFYKKSDNRVLIAYSCPAEERQLEQHEGFVKLHEHQVISFEYSWTLWECRTDKAIKDQNAQ